MRNYLLSVLIFISLLASSKAALASCSVPNSVKKEAETAAVIFVGRAKKITPAQLAEADLIDSKNPKWKKRFIKTDVVTFSVIEAFKGVSEETIEIATSAEGDANIKFEGGTWLKEGQT